jgi:hypothetical protein
MWVFARLTESAIHCPNWPPRNRESNREAILEGVLPGGHSDQDIGAPAVSNEEARMAAPASTLIPVGAAGVGAALAWGLNRVSPRQGGRGYWVERLSETSSTVAATVDAVRSANASRVLSSPSTLLLCTYVAPAAIFSIFFLIPLDPAATYVAFLTLAITTVGVALPLQSISTIGGIYIGEHGDLHGALSHVSRTYQRGRLGVYLLIGQLWAGILYVVAVLTYPPPAELFQPTELQFVFVLSIALLVVAAIVIATASARLGAMAESQAYACLLASGVRPPAVSIATGSSAPGLSVQGVLLGIGERCLVESGERRVSLDWSDILVVEIESGRQLRTANSQKEVT